MPNFSKNNNRTCTFIRGTRVFIKKLSNLPEVIYDNAMHSTLFYHALISQNFYLSFKICFGVDEPTRVSLFENELPSLTIGHI